MTTNKKPNETIFLLALATVVAVGVYFFYTANPFGAARTKSVNQQAATPVSPAITNTQELDAAARDLDNTNPNQIDSQLNQLNTNATGF